MSLEFYGLMIAPLESDTSINLAGEASILDAYLRCAAVCHASFAYHGYRWTLVTDAPDRIVEGYERLGLEAPPVRAVDFAWEVPSDLRFRAAHYKLELLQRFASGAYGDRVGLVDLDTICIAVLPPIVTDHGALVGYDMSEAQKRSPATSASVESLRALGVPTDQPRWWGGEFVVGDKEHFASLGEHLTQLWPRYLANEAAMAHVGDEMILTAAMMRLEADEIELRDGGAGKAIARFWSARTLAPFPRFGAAREASILHLPADKPFIARHAGQPFSPDGFLSGYERYLRRKTLLRRPLALAARLIGSPRRFAPRL